MPHIIDAQGPKARGSHQRRCLLILLLLPLRPTVRRPPPLLLAPPPPPVVVGNGRGEQERESAAAVVVVAAAAAAGGGGGVGGGEAGFDDSDRSVEHARDGVEAEDLFLCVCVWEKERVGVSMGRREESSICRLLIHPPIPPSTHPSIHPTFTFTSHSHKPPNPPTF
jgi:hypothetical protein